MKLTGRGIVAVLVAGLAIGLAASFGARALNGVAAPMLGAVGLGALIVWRAEPPTVEVTPVADGHPGETRTVRFDLEGSGVCRVALEWPDGLDGDPIDAVVALPATIEAEVEYVDRGVYGVRLDRLRHRDPIGLVETSVDVPAEESAVVYPTVHLLANRGDLAGLFPDETAVERQEFDTLREYQPGDPLRHVHWKSSAKHDEFLVTEFSPSQRTETVVIAGEATAGCADAMAEVVATIAMVALRAGLTVGLRLPEETLPPGSGEVHTANLLRVLARAGHGQLEDHDHDLADVSISARPRETLVRIGSGTLMFSDLVAGPEADDETAGADGAADDESEVVAA